MRDFQGRAGVIGPTYVTIPVRDRHEWIAALVGQLARQGPEAIFVFDNESDPPQPTWGEVVPIPAPAMQLHEMWNTGLDMAEEHAKAAGYDLWNVAVLNSDLRVGPNFLYTLARGLRAHPNTAIAYPNIYKAVPYNDIAEFDNPNYARQTMSGYAWMLAGETGLRVDEQFGWWYGDSDIELQARKAGYNVISVGACKAPEHLDANGSVYQQHRLTQIRADETRFAAKWGIDPAELFLACNPDFGL